MRVLLADDEQKVRSALRLLLEHEPGLMVTGEAVDGEQVMRMVAADAPDVVLLDWELPVGGGQAILAGLRAVNGVRVIALSGRSEARPLAMAAGVDGFISKQAPPEELLAAVRAVGARRAG